MNGSIEYRKLPMNILGSVSHAANLAIDWINQKSLSCCMCKKTISSNESFFTEIIDERGKKSEHVYCEVHMERRGCYRNGKCAEDIECYFEAPPSTVINGMRKPPRPIWLDEDGNTPAWLLKAAEESDSRLAMADIAAVLASRTN
jgi:hypothetical protein